MSAMKYQIVPIPPPPPTQALNSPTFNIPPINGSLTLPELYDWHLQNTPNHALFVYSDDHGTEHVVLWPQGVRAFHRSARIVIDRVGHKASGIPVVAILATADTMTYFTVMAGIFRAGYTAFPISPRNSAAAIAHLLRKVNVSHVLVGPENALQDLVSRSLALIEGPESSKATTSLIPTFGEIFRPDSETFVPLGSCKSRLEDAAVILHSSGSTAFPKPITWTHYQLLQVGYTPFFGEIDFTGRRLSCHSMPMFHGMGMMQTVWTAMSGVVITAFEPRSPAILPDPDSVIKACMNTKSDIIFCVPSFVDAWSRNQEYIEYLKSIFGILYGGGPLNKAVGDNLWKRGVGIFILYGCTEVGIMSPILPEKSDEDWEYFRLSKNIAGKLIPDGSGNAELVVIPGAFEVPCVFNTKLDGVDAYATSDLLSPHPTKPNYWKVFGRADDQIMHSTGEKTNPGPLESIMNQDSHILSAVMFGRGMFYPGLLVDPKPAFKFDPSDEEALGAFRNLIWPSVERLNEYAPRHSHIFKEMILVATPEKPFTYTAKNTARRQAVIADYDEEIDALYIAVQETTQPHISPPPKWTRSSTLIFIRSIISEVLKREILDGEDMFESGCDSLQATWIRNTVLNALERTKSADVRVISSSFVYQHPTISSLVSYIMSLVEGSEVTDGDGTSTGKIETMHSLVIKYAAGLRQHAGTREPGSDSDGSIEEVVLVTGTTGWLGSLILAELLQSDVKRVFALNRKGASALVLRQPDAFEERGLDSNLVRSEKLVLLEADLTDRTLGLDERMMEEIKNSVTHIIHNAYPVNFNKSLGSFESSILSLRHLIDLSLSSSLRDPPRLVFISSVSVINGHPGEEPVKEKFVDARSALGSGYGESKWVCESILRDVAVKTSLKPIVVRVGQLSGISTSGFWNPKEWVPALFKSSIMLGCLPLIENDVSWIPIDIAARAVYDMRNSSHKVLHLAHPNPVSWVTIFSAASNELKIPLVPYSEWFEKLSQSARGLGAESSVSTEERSPALRILDFFNASNVYGNEQKGQGNGLETPWFVPCYEFFPKLGKREHSFASLSEESAGAWISYWKNVKFLDDQKYQAYVEDDRNVLYFLRNMIEIVSLNSSDSGPSYSCLEQEQVCVFEENYTCLEVR